MADTNENKEQKSTVEAGAAPASTTQGFLDIDQIREGIVILKDGGMRMVLLCSAVNFELKSDIERDSVILGYQNFINSLDFPIQILVQSRKLDLSGYLSDLERRGQKESNELLQTQINDYVLYVRGLIELANIMEKRFYVVVPHYPAGFQKVGFLAQLFGNQATVTVNNFEDEKKSLRQKVQTVAQGLQGIGLRAAQLDTQELIELYYSTYNPDQATTQKLIDVTQLESEIIAKLPEDMEIG
ncbi:MAG: hypothetical protein WC045_02835 [Patescibacteria group bacterium]